MKTLKTLDWGAWTMPGWEPKTRFANISKNWNTCGSATLSLVTGRNPGIIEQQLPRSQRHWSTSAVMRFLDARGWDVALLGSQSVCDSLSSFRWNDRTLTDEHLLMFNCLSCRGEASWFLFEHGNIWHNFYVETTSPLFFLRRPLQDAILLRR